MQTLKATACAFANLAFLKYWGKTDHELNLPSNNSISMNLSSAQTTTTVEFSENLTDDQVITKGADEGTKGTARITKHVDLIRQMAGTDLRAHIETENNFPASAGFASSASGFAALTLACVSALGLQISEREMTILARRGSGSACRSIPSGFVEWVKGGSSETSYAHQIAPPDHWDIADVAVVVSTQPKSVSSSLGHQLAQNSAFWDARQQSIQERSSLIHQAILDRDFTTFGQELEKEALSMHTVALTSPYERDGQWYSGIYYWLPDTLELMLQVQNWRVDGLPVYFTLDAGPTAHLICIGSAQDEITARVEALRKGRNWSVITSKPARGAYLV